MNWKTLAAVTIGAVGFALAPARASAGQRAPFYGRYFAHRGLHSAPDGMPENSLAAFARAAECGYGVELDVHLTADDEVVVFHDSALARMTGAEGRIEDWTYGQLTQLTLAGSTQRIPLLREVLAVIDGAGPIILEIKPDARRTRLCEKTLEILQTYRGDVCVESFDPRILYWFRRHASGYLRGQLAMPAAHYDPETTSKPLAQLAARGLLNFVGRPQFIAYELGPRPLTVRLAEGLGAMKVRWTSRSAYDHPDAEAVIFEHYRPERYL